jgi:hypothetical protein
MHKGILGAFQAIRLFFCKIYVMRQLIICQRKRILPEMGNGQPEPWNKSHQNH